MIEFEELPRGLPRAISDEDEMSRALWMAPEGLNETEKWGVSRTSLLIGMDRNGGWIGNTDDRHLITIAGSRSGKGVGCILPNLLTYEGSILVLDPKGENANETAERRGDGDGVPAGGMGHDVYVIDPFGAADGVPDKYRGGYNPIDYLDPGSKNFIDDCDTIADAVVVTTGNESTTYFNDTAKMIIRGFVAWVATSENPDERTLPHAHFLLSQGEKDFEATAEAMAKQPDRAAGLPATVANMAANMDAEEWEKVMSSVRQHLSFLESPPMADLLKNSDRNLDMKAWKMGGKSVYLCLPAGRLHRHNRFFRLFLNQLLAAVELNKEEPGIRAVMMLDEMHVLGHMQILETSAALIAGYGVRIWSIWQDISQLEAIYAKRWETFIGNASVMQCFGLNDMKTLKYVSDRLGMSAVTNISTSAVSIGQANTGFDGTSRSYSGNPLVSPDEVAYYFSRQSDAQLVIYPGADPIWMKRLKHYEPSFKEWRVGHE